MSRFGIIAGLSLKSAAQRTCGFPAGIDWSRRLRMEAVRVNDSAVRTRTAGRPVSETGPAFAQPTPSAALARAVNALKNPSLWPLNRFWAVRNAAAARAPALAGEEGRITEQVGRLLSRKSQRFGMTCADPCLPSVRSGTTSLPSPLLNAVTPVSESRKMA